MLKIASFGTRLSDFNILRLSLTVMQYRTDSVLFVKCAKKRAPDVIVLYNLHHTVARCRSLMRKLEPVLVGPYQKWSYFHQVRS